MSNSNKNLYNMRFPVFSTSPPLMSRTTGFRPTSTEWDAEDMFCPTKNEPQDSATFQERGEEEFQHTFTFALENTVYRGRCQQPIVTNDCFRPQVIHQILPLDDVKMPRRPEVSNTRLFDREELRESISRRIIAGRGHDEDEVPLPPTPIVTYTPGPADNFYDLKISAKQYLNPSHADFESNRQKFLQLTRQEMNLERTGSFDPNLKELSGSTSEFLKEINKQTKQQKRKEFGPRNSDLQRLRKQNSLSGIEDKADTNLQTDTTKTSGKHVVSEPKAYKSTKTTQTSLFDFKNMTLDWAATAGGGYPSERMSFLKEYFSHCSKQELFCARSIATKCYRKRVQAEREKKLNPKRPKCQQLQSRRTQQFIETSLAKPSIKF